MKLSRLGQKRTSGIAKDEHTNDHRGRIVKNRQVAL
jgi:hypothetical protein